MRLLYTLFTLAAGGYGLFWIAEKNPDLKQKAEEIIDMRTTDALETRYSAHQVMDDHQRQLLKDKGARFLDPELKFYPYLLMEVKYSDKNRTKEALILWDMTDGEMILDTKTWEKTHGFADCIQAGAMPHEFQILQLLSEKGGTLDVATIQTSLGIETALLDGMLKGCIRKNLILSNGANKFRIHLESPKLTKAPETKLYEPLTTRPHRRATRASKHFSKSQIERISKMAFGESFTIRACSEIYLPVHRVLVQKADGSLHTFHFNGLSGKELPAAPFYY